MCNDPKAELNNLIANAESEGIIFANSNGEEITIRIKNEDDITLRIPKGADPDKIVADYLINNPKVFKGVERSVMVMS